jgi:flavin-dependent dehydrogenase
MCFPGLVARSPVKSVAVVGDGPSGTALATHLARAGLRVGLFSRGRPKPPIVGESTVPAVVPYLRELGIEEEVRSYGVYKPGAIFTLDEGSRVELDFAGACRGIPGYAYNLPRDRFDATLLATCARGGVRVIEAPARLERADDGERVRLADACLEAAGDCFDGQPDLIVDATGRARTLARLLDLPTQAGERRDTALFAHFEGVECDPAGCIHSDVLEHGWGWRIPLVGRVSLGVVVEPGVLKGFGTRVEEQFEAYLRSEPRLDKLTGNARRLTPVMKYSNYQLTTLRAVGPGWALVGDAFGFIDPVFSSGLHLAFSGARTLANAVLAGTPRALRRYERDFRRQLAGWRDAVDMFYDRRFFAVLRLRAAQPRNTLQRLLNRHAERHIPPVFTGEGTASAYNRLLLRLSADFALREEARAGGES